MPSVYLTRDESESGSLPPVCARCGAHADDWVTKRFSWSPPWVLALLLLGLLPLLIGVLITTKRMTVHVPMCEEHKGHWRWRTWTLLLSFFGVLALAIGGIVMVSSQPKGGGDATAIVSLVAVCLFLAWLVAAAIISSSAIRAGEMTNDDVKLIKVCAVFRDAVHDQRRAERSARRRSEGREEDEDSDDGDDERQEDHRIKRG